MAFSFNGGGIGRSRFRGTGRLSDINVVPLVDVVLVLLIIFMITAQAMEFGLEIDVPKVRQSERSAEDLPVVSVTRAGEIFLADKPVNINALGEAIRERYGERGKAAYVRADKATTWDAVAQVISALGEAKIEVRTVTKAEESLRPQRR
jgi:biopolymer transport protein ExbD